MTKVRSSFNQRSPLVLSQSYDGAGRQVLMISHSQYNTPQFYLTLSEKAEFYCFPKHFLQDSVILVTADPSEAESEPDCRPYIMTQLQMSWSQSGAKVNRISQRKVTLNQEQINVNLRTALWVKNQNEFDDQYDSEKFLVRTVKGDTVIMTPYRLFKPYATTSLELEPSRTL